MKKVQDHYFKRARKEGYPARSVYKLEEVQQRFRFMKKGDRVIDLGCHPGSWSMYAARVVGPSGLVVGIDLTTRKKLHVTGGAPIKTVTGDIMTEDALAEIRSLSPDYSVLVSDMAPKTTGNKWADQQQSLNLSRRALEIAVKLLGAGGSFYCKVFEGEDFRGFVDQTRDSFDLVKVVKPKSSRPESREVFVFARGLRKASAA